MKLFALILCSGFFIAAPASADISDSGTLSLGGNAVVVGSMTVQGGGGLLVNYGVSASSVVASSATLSATGSGIYALTSSTGIHILNGKIALDSGAYIQWPDGTTSTTSAGGGGGGNAILTATQTWSGANTFTSTADFTNASLPGVLHQFGGNASTAAVVAVTSYTFGNSALWVASATYMCNINMILPGAGDVIVLRMANDSTANYFWGAHANDSAINAAQSQADFGSGFALQSLNQSGVKANGYVEGDVTFQTVQGSSTTVSARWATTMTTTSPRVQSFVGGGQYRGGKGFTAPTIVLRSSTDTAPASTMTGTLRCRKWD